MSLVETLQRIAARVQKLGKYWFLTSMGITALQMRALRSCHHIMWQWINHACVESTQQQYPHCVYNGHFINEGLIYQTIVVDAVTSTPRDPKTNMRLWVTLLYGNQYIVHLFWHIGKTFIIKPFYNNRRILLMSTICKDINCILKTNLFGFKVIRSN